MRTLLASALLLVLASPVAAQSTPEAVPADTLAEAPVDPRVVGEWTLNEVAEAGTLGRMGAEVRAMRCAFAADGTATVSMTLLQDEDRIERSTSFAFETEDGQIVPEAERPVGYRVLADGRLELADPTGLVVRLVRAGA